VGHLLRLFMASKMIIKNKNKKSKNRTSIKFYDLVVVGGVVELVLVHAVGAVFLVAVTVVHVITFYRI